MAHFAEIGLNNKVLRVVTINNQELLDENNVEQEQLGADFCRNLFGGTWIQTSFNAASRGTFATVGSTYDADLDIFIPPKPYNSWSWNSESLLWEPPTPRPNNDFIYVWNEESTNWIQVN